MFFFGRKIERRNIKMLFLAPKNKKKTKFGRPLSLELITDIRQISVVISDIPAQSEVAAFQCVFSRRLNHCPLNQEGCD